MAAAATAKNSQVDAESPEFTSGPTVDNPNSNVFVCYKLFVDTVRKLGIIPIVYIDDEKEPKVKVQHKFTWWYLFHCFNYIYISCNFTKQWFVLWYNYYNGFEYDTVRSGYMYQVLWVFGYCMMITIFLTQAFNKKQVASVITMWLRIEKYLEIHGLPEPEKKKKRRFKIILFQFYGYLFAQISCWGGLVGMALFMPEFPPFLNSVLVLKNGPPLIPELREMYTTDTLFHWLYRIGTTVYECYLGIFAWAIFFSLDMFINMMCMTISHAMKKVQELLTADNQNYLLNNYQQQQQRSSSSFTSSDGSAVQYLTLYQSLRILITAIHVVYGRLLFFQEFLNMGCSVILIYGALYPHDSIFHQSFFITNAIGISLRIYLFYLPMSYVYTNSLKFKKALIIQSTLKYKRPNYSYVLNPVDNTTIPATNRQQVHPTAAAEEDEINSVPGMFNEEARIRLGKQLYKMVKSCRVVVFRPWGFHRISPTSMRDYTLATFSYFVTIKQI